MKEDYEEFKKENKKQFNWLKIKTDKRFLRDRLSCQIIQLINDVSRGPVKGEILIRFLARPQEVDP